MSCLMCARPVPTEGDTCSLDCYRHFHAYLKEAGPYIPQWMPKPNSMETQPWYAAEQERMEKHAEEHEID